MKKIIYKYGLEIISSILVSFLFWASLFEHPLRYLAGNYDYYLTNLFANKISFLYYNEFPYFSSYIGGGFPLWANPSNIFISIPQFFSIILSNQWLSIRISILTLSILSMFGMFILLRQLEIDNFGCRLFGAIVYTFSGYMVSQLTIGHFWIQNMVFAPYMVSAFIWSYKNNKFSFAIPIWLTIMVYAGMNATSISIIMLILSFLTFYNIKNFIIYVLIALFLSAPKILASYQLLSWFPRNLEMGYVAQSWWGTVHTLITSLIWPNQRWFDSPYKYASPLEVYLINCYVGIIVLFLAIFSAIGYKKHKYNRFSLSLIIIICLTVFLYPGGLNPFWKILSKNMILSSLHMPTWFVGSLILPIAYFSSLALYDGIKIMKKNTNFILISICVFIFIDYFRVNKPNIDYIQSYFTFDNRTYFDKKRVFEQSKGPDWNLFSMEDKTCFESDLMFTYLQNNESVLHFYDGIFGYDEFGFLRRSSVKSGRIDIFNKNKDIKIEWISPSKISLEILKTKQAGMEIPININYFPGWKILGKTDGITLINNWTPEKWGLLTVHIDEQFPIGIKQKILLKYLPYWGLKPKKITEFNMLEQKKILSDENIDWFAKAEEFYESYDFKNAIDAYKIVVKVDSDCASAYESIGWAMSKLKSHKESVEYFEKASLLRKKYGKLKRETAIIRDTKDYFVRGANYFLEKKYDEAINDFSTAISMDDNYVKAYYYRGVAYYNLQNFSKAIDDVNKVIYFNPKNSGAYNRRGSIYLSLGENEKAVSDFNKSLKMNSKAASTYKYLGILLYNEKKYREAEKVYRKALKIYPNYLDVYNNLGMLLYNSKRVKEAEKVYRKALKINPNSAVTHCNLGILLFNSGRIEEAEKEFKKAIQIEPYFIEAHRNLITFYFKQEEYGKALQHCRIALQLSPDNKSIQNDLKLIKRLLSKI